MFNLDLTLEFGLALVGCYVLIIALCWAVDHDKKAVQIHYCIDCGLGHKSINEAAICCLSSTGDYK